MSVSDFASRYLNNIGYTRIGYLSHEFKTMQDLVLCPPRWFEFIRYIGKKTIAQFDEALEPYGLHVGISQAQIDDILSSEGLVDNEVETRINAIKTALAANLEGKGDEYIKGFTEGVNYIPNNIKL